MTNDFPKTWNTTKIFLNRKSSKDKYKATQIVFSSHAKLHICLHNYSWSMVPFSLICSLSPIGFHAFPLKLSISPKSQGLGWGSCSSINKKWINTRQKYQVKPARLSSLLLSYNAYTTFRGSCSSTSFISGPKNPKFQGATTSKMLSYSWEQISVLLQSTIL